METKTVTTTTTTKRAFPPLMIREKLLGKLDANEYPLASKAIPAGLTNFSYNLGDGLDDIYDDKDHTPTAEVSLLYLGC